LGFIPYLYCIIMQKLINLMAVTSFAINVGVIAGGVYLYQNKDQMIEDIRSRVAEEVAEAIPEIIGNLGFGGTEVPEPPIPSGLPFWV